MPPARRRSFVLAAAGFSGANMITQNFTEDNWLAIEIFTSDLREPLEAEYAAIKALSGVALRKQLRGRRLYLKHQIATLRWMESLAETKRNGTPAA